jgi:hypothetical protein
VKKLAKFEGVWSNQQDATEMQIESIINHVMQTHNVPMKGWILDIRNYPDDIKKEYLKDWLEMMSHKCNSGLTHCRGHRWKEHYLDKDLNVWIWKCDVCEAVRITTTMCDDIWVRPKRRSFEYDCLIVTDCFFKAVL